MTTTRFATRAQWGGVWTTSSPPSEALNDPVCMFHHVGGSAWMGEDAFQVFRELNAYAQNTKGYQFLDYDLLVHYSRRDDLVTIGEGRGAFRSAATLDYNEQSEAIVVCGNFQLREITPQELEGACQAMAIAIQRGWLARNASVMGHRDNPEHPNATACPGENFYNDLKWIRPRVDQILGTTPTPVPPTPDPTPPIVVPGGIVLLYRVVSGDSYWKICEKVTEDGKATNERVQAIQQANGNKALQPGDVINIPGRVAV